MTKSINQQSYRQGDTLLRKIDALPANIKPAPKDNAGRVVLAHGERTGHAHAFRDSTVCGFYMENADKRVSRTDGCPHYIQVGGSGATLNHEYINGKKAEHDAIEIPAGIYEVAVQVEESAEFMNQVVD